MRFFAIVVVVYALPLYRKYLIRVCFELFHCHFVSYEIRHFEKCKTILHAHECEELCRDLKRYAYMLLTKIEEECFMQWKIFAVENLIWYLKYEI